MTIQPQSGDYWLHIRPLASSIPVEVRLRRWLKLGLRPYSLRCLRIEPMEPTNTASGNAPPEQKKE